MTVWHLQGEQARIDSLVPFPNNPRVGDVGAIKESLRKLGQYRPIVADRKTRRILAGHHVWQAARDLGFATINVSWIDADEETCRRIVLADNRTADLGSYRHDELTDLLESLPTLEATGYESIPKQPDLGEALIAPKPETVKPRKQVIVGGFRYKVDDHVWDRWHDLALEDAGGKKQMPYYLAGLLGMTVTVEAPAAAAEEPAPAGEESIAIIEVIELPIDSVQPFRHNPREGDIGAIAQSLTKLGQFRPIVVNRSSREILVGNHTWMAAKMLGWKHIGVAWVDVDDETATRIVLMDNRATDLATYDEQHLRTLLLSIPTLEGTGWDGDDLDDLIRGLEHRPKATKKARVSVGTYRIPVDTEELNRWLLTLPAGRELATIAQRLSLDPSLN